MNDLRKTKAQLIEELQQARQLLVERAAAGTQHQQTEEVIAERRQAAAALRESEERFRVAQAVARRLHDFAKRS
jgi:hypothetical protein